MKTKAVVTLFLVSFALGVAAFVKNAIDLDDVQLTYAEAPADIAAALAGTKIMFLSDIHVRSIGPREKKVLALADEVRPDFILISGDLMPYGGPIDPSLEFFRRLVAPRGAYAVLGDAEYKDGIRNCLYCHAPGSWAIRDDLPVKVLRDQVATLEGPHGAVDLWGGDAKERPRDLSWAAPTAPGRPAIAMVHFPELAALYADAGASLVLAGDTHGGQAIGPAFIYDLLLSKKRSPFLKGRFDVGGAALWVSRGLGWTIAPIRIGVKPEVIVFDMTRERSVEAQGGD